MWLSPPMETPVHTAVMLTCQFYGQPGIQYQWLMDGKILDTKYHKIYTVKETGNVNSTYVYKLEVYDTVMNLFIANSRACELSEDKHTCNCSLIYQCTTQYPGSKVKASKTTTLKLTGFKSRL